MKKTPLFSIRNNISSLTKFNRTVFYLPLITYFTIKSEDLSLTFLGSVLRVRFRGLHREAIQILLNNENRELSLFSVFLFEFNEIVLMRHDFYS